MTARPQSPADPSARRATRGFTLLEMLVIVGVVGILAALTIPELMSVIRRSRVEGAAQTMTRLLLDARAEAVYRGSPVIVHPDVRLGDDGGEEHYLVAWVDVDEDGEFDGTINGDGTYEANTAAVHRTEDYVLYEWRLPNRGINRTSSNVYFWGAADDNPSVRTDAVDGLTTKPDGVSNTSMVESDGYGDWEAAVIFLDNGSVAEEGGIRFAMGPFDGGDREVNFLELRIAPKASGRVELRKYIPAPIGTYEGKGYDDPYDLSGYRHEWEWY